MDITSNTPKVLDRCLELFDNPSVARDSQSKPSTPTPYASHPDIQFFSSVKSKHHFAYHQSKVKQAKTLSKSKRNPSLFNPYSRPQLLERLETYTSLNWAIPYTTEDILTELECARAGWLNTKRGSNHLQCISCQSHIILRFNDIDCQPKYSVLPLNLPDIAALNHQLKISYLDKLRLSAHAKNCPWRNIQCPSKVYYLPPHLASTDEVLLKGYLATLKTALDDIKDINLFASALLGAVESYTLPDIVPVSKQWLLATYYNDTKENFESMLDMNLPRAVYLVSALGWTLELANFPVKTILVLKCRSCTQKHFLEPDASSFDLSHKNWCLQSSEMDSVPFRQYFCNMLVGSERNIGPSGKYQNDTGVEELVFSKKSKPNQRIDVNETLNKLSNLSKLYFADTA